MSNSLSASFPEIWAKEQQEVFYKKNVAMEVADTSFRATMSKGDTLNRPYRSNATIQSYTRGTGVTIDDLTDTNEQLSVNLEFATGFYRDDFEQIQDNYDIAANYGKDYGIVLSNQVDADVLAEIANAANYIDDGDIGGSAGNPITIATTNVIKLFGAAKRKLAKESVPMENLAAVISPEMEDILVQYGMGRDTSMGDTLNKEGYIGKFNGFELYRSNMLLGEAKMHIATNASADDTVTLNGVVFTFKAAPSAAGEVDIGGTPDASRANLTAAVNGGAGAGTDYIEVSVADRRKLYNATATNNDTTDDMLVTYAGIGAMSVESSMVAGGVDIWTVNDQIQHNYFCSKGATTLVLQSEPKVQIKDVADKLGKNCLNGLLYGVKTFLDGTKKMIDVRVASSTF